jgi:hypothetical protein
MFRRWRRPLLMLLAVMVMSIDDGWGCEPFPDGCMVALNTVGLV